MDNRTRRSDPEPSIRWYRVVAEKDVSELPFARYFKEQYGTR